MSNVFVANLSVIVAVMMLASAAHALGKRKVTKFEYDTAGRQIATKVYDDVGASAQLVNGIIFMGFYTRFHGKPFNGLHAETLLAK